MQFIERAALWTGQVGRRSVASTFDVSISNVTLDFQRYREIAPRNLAYDVAAKCFRPTEVFEPVFGRDDPSSVLTTIAATASLPLQDRSRLLGFAPSVDTVQPLPVAIDQDLLALVCKSITAGSTMTITYQSMNTPHPVERSFSPHALIFTGQRWLVRGWDDRHRAYRDLALARIMSVAPGENTVALPRDDHWHDRVRILLGLADGLSPSQAAVTAREFGMSLTDGSYAVEFEPRKAMVPYVLDQLRLRGGQKEGGPVRIKNYSDIRSCDRPGSREALPTEKPRERV
ncbi:WYL domain-containing protein [Pararhizobium sp. YC-54]|uniref:helix-turn-helix transcriptional regulator n=1 Tax=Pararhizobium sp. YC-54 TaxID=2986920 RepID=UPI0021F6EDEA|nr:WYL domain-containing protein [Pararhizobium sp. YC-54]MCV9999445.1 WYL domain-containing protein [Pararhizobium sp. YC-54]